MRLSKPTVGPIVGHTTPHESRLWFRGDFKAAPHGFHRCFGAVRWRDKGSTSSAWRVKVGKLSPNFDMTGVFPLIGLEPDSIYEYQVGWFFADLELDTARATPQFDWHTLEVFTFQSGTINNSQERVYAVGSCRYLLRLFGSLVFDDRGDKTFASILSLHQQKSINGLLMIGDQIYADDLNAISSDQYFQSFLIRYRAAFSQWHLSKLMSKVPTYMILDDHEIEDNWPSNASAKDMITKYPNAIHAYQIYQASHSPVFSLNNDGWITGTPTKFWYTFSDGCVEWFVMDVRTERIWHSDPAKRQMIKQSQMNALLDWLPANPDKVKMIVTSVPFFPDINNDTGDKWSAFLSERARILDYILLNKIRKVCFISGDVHCSVTVKLTTETDENFKVFSIVSSSFFWPYPHMKQNDFALNGVLAGHGQNKYKVSNTSEIYSDDNFARLEVNPDSVTVSFFERKGDPLGKPTTLTF